MMSFKSQKLFFALLLSIPNLSYSKTIADAASCQKVGDCPYLFDVVSGDKEFKKKMGDFMKLPETINESWIPEGTASPSLPIILNDLTYVLFSTCQPHNCDSNSYVLAYQLKTNKLMGLHIDADNKKTPVNSPGKDEIKLMIDFHDDKIGDTEGTLPIKYIAANRAIILDGKEYSDTSLGGFESWVCRDFLPLQSQRILIEIGALSNPSLNNLGFVLYDGGNSGESTRYKRVGLNLRWDWGKKNEYAFMIKPDGTGLYYDFTNIPSGETAKASQLYKCTKL